MAKASPAAALLPYPPRFFLICFPDLYSDREHGLPFAYRHERGTERMAIDAAADLDQAVCSEEPH